MTATQHPTRTERSAGGVVWRRTTTLPDVLVILDSHDHWAFPKGRLELGEDAETAARREVAEETGLTQLTLTTALPTSDFWFEDKWEVPGERVHKFVAYFLFELMTPQRVITSTDEHIEAFQWLALTELEPTITYASLAAVVAATIEQLSVHPRGSVAK